MPVLAWGRVKWLAASAQSIRGSAQRRRGCRGASLLACARAALLPLLRFKEPAIRDLQPSDPPPRASALPLAHITAPLAFTGFTACCCCLLLWGAWGCVPSIYAHGGAHRRTRYVAHRRTRYVRAGGAAPANCSAIECIQVCAVCACQTRQAREGTKMVNPTCGLAWVLGS